MRLAQVYFATIPFRVYYCLCSGETQNVFHYMAEAMYYTVSYVLTDREQGLLLFV